MHMRQFTTPALAGALIALGTTLAPAQAADPEPVTKRVVVSNKGGSVAAGSLGTRVSIAPRPQPADGAEKSD